MSTFAQIAEPFVCGGSAATFASCVIHPMDLAKVCNDNVRKWRRKVSDNIRTELNAALTLPC